MSHLYTIKVDYPNNTLENPSTASYLDTAIVYNSATETYEDGPLSNINAQLISDYAYISDAHYVNSISYSGYKLQFFNFLNCSQQFKIKNMFFSGYSIQPCNLYNFSTQFKLKNILTNYIKFQSLNYEKIKNYTKQFYLLNILTNSVKLQTIKLSYINPFSRQRTARDMVFANLQKIDFKKKEKDKILWMLRAKNIETNKYDYWSSQNINSSKNPLTELNGSKEILGSYYITGNIELPIFGNLYINQDNSLIQNISTTLRKNEEGVIVTGDDKRTILHKNTMEDQKKIKLVFINRGVQINKNYYTYWRNTNLIIDGTTYNTQETSNENIGLNYERRK